MNFILVSSVFGAGALNWGHWTDIKKSNQNHWLVFEEREKLESQRKTYSNSLEVYPHVTQSLGIKPSSHSLEASALLHEHTKSTGSQQTWTRLVNRSLEPWYGESKSVRSFKTSRVQIRWKRASKGFEYLNIHCCFLAMDACWTLKLGQREVNLSVWPSPEFECDWCRRSVILSARCRGKLESTCTFQPSSIYVWVTTREAEKSLKSG